MTLKKLEKTDINDLVLVTTANIFGRQRTRHVMRVGNLHYTFQWVGTSNHCPFGDVLSVFVESDKTELTIL